jgi:hypothetical protein
MASFVLWLVTFIMDIDTSQGFLHVKQEVIYIQAFFRPVNATVFVKYQHYVNAQNRVKMLELKDSDSSKVKGQIHALENQIVKMEQQNERFQERNEALESRLVAFEVEQMKQRRIIKVLENRIAQVGCPPTGASFLPVPVLSLGRKSVHVNRVTAQNMA